MTNRFTKRRAERARGGAPSLVGISVNLRTLVVHCVLGVWNYVHYPLMTELFFKAGPPQKSGVFCCHEGQVCAQIDRSVQLHSLQPEWTFCIRTFAAASSPPSSCVENYCDMLKSAGWSSASTPMQLDGVASCMVATQLWLAAMCYSVAF